MDDDHLTRVNAQISLLDRSGIPEVQEFVDKLRRCKMPRPDLTRVVWHKNTFTGEAYQAVHVPHPKCGHVGCVGCKPYLQEKEALHAWDAKLDGDAYGEDEVSTMSINGPLVEWDSQEHWGITQKFIRHVKDAIRDLGMGTESYLEPSMTKDGMIMIGLHGVLIHPGRTREEVQALLKLRFKDNLRVTWWADRAVYLKPQKDPKMSLRNNALGWLEYATKVFKEKDAGLTQENLIKLTYAMARMRTNPWRENTPGGRQGLRVQVRLKMRKAIA